ncbi:MAG: AI-2E family transporter [Paludibacteraceae bacterium]|nr:AI-2E family transporter [Paludibacteraceae bacterium]MBN2788350.1 AI-2E family transporter [Paludibacteraceae bacterium]
MNPSFEKPFTFDRVVRIVIGIVVAITLYFLVNKLSGVLLPFLIAWLLAYMIHPLVNFFQYRLRVKNRVLSIFFALLSIAIVLIGLLFLIIPPIINEISQTGGLISVYIEHIELNSFLPPDVKFFLVEWLNKVDLEQLLNQENIKQGVETLVPQFWSLLSGSFDFIISLFVVVVIFLYTLFILADYEKITDGWIQFVPQKYRYLLSEIVDDLEEGMNKYFRGQALIASIVGLLFAVSFEIIDLPLGLILGLLIGVLTMVPYLKIVMIFPVGFVALLKSIETGQSYWMVVLTILVIFILIQAFEDLVLIPKIMGKAMGMNPAVILLSLSVWGALLGIAGMIIALPITTIIVSYYKRFILGTESFFEPEKSVKTKARKKTNKVLKG